MDADVPRCEIGGRSVRLLPGRLHRSHQIVVVDDALSPEKADGYQGSAFLHQRGGEPRHSDKGMARYIHGLRETVSGAVDDARLQVLSWREGDRMKQEIEAAPFICYGVENRLELPINANVTGHEQRRARASATGRTNGTALSLR